jgi:hypothetical protein
MSSSTSSSTKSTASTTSSLDLDVKELKIFQISGSLAGDYHLYRQLRGIEMKRLNDMDAAYHAEQEQRAFEEKRAAH